MPFAIINPSVRQIPASVAAVRRKKVPAVLPPAFGNVHFRKRSSTFQQNKKASRSLGRPIC